MNSSTIAEQMIYKEIQKKAKILSKSTRCLICGKETSSMCNSHVVPAFILKEISFSVYKYPSTSSYVLSTIKL